MSERSQRHECYTRLQRNVGIIAALDAVSPTLHRAEAQKLRDEKNRLEISILGDALYLLMSFIEAVHVIAENSTVAAKRDKQEMGWAPGDDVVKC